MNKWNPFDLETTIKMNEIGIEIAIEISLWYPLTDIMHKFIDDNQFFSSQRDREKKRRRSRLKDFDQSRLDVIIFSNHANTISNRKFRFIW